MDEPKQIMDLTDKLSEYTSCVEPVEGTGKPFEFVEFNQKWTPPHTETSYVPDLTQGEFQP